MGLSPNLGMAWGFCGGLVGVWWRFGGGLVVVFETGQEQCYLQQPKSGNSMGVWGGLVMVFEREQEQCHLQQSATQTWAWHGYGYSRAKRLERLVF